MRPASACLPPFATTSSSCSPTPRRAPGSRRGIGVCSTGSTEPTITWKRTAPSRRGNERIDGEESMALAERFEPVPAEETTLGSVQIRVAVLCALIQMLDGYDL